MRGSRVANEALAAGLVEETAVVEGALLGLPVRRVPHGIPRIEMRVKVQDRDGLLVDLVQGPQGRQGNAVVAAERDELGLPGGDALGSVRGGRRGQGRSGPKLHEGLVHLALGEAVVERRDWDVAAVFYGGPGAVRVDPGSGVV